MNDQRLQLLVPVRTRDGEVWITRHAVERYVEREQSLRRGTALTEHQVVARLRSRMKGGRIRRTAPAAGMTGDEDGYLVTGAYVWPLRKRPEGDWIALTTVDR